MMKTDLDVALHDLSGAQLEAGEAPVAADDFEDEAAIPRAEAKAFRPEAAASIPPRKAQFPMPPRRPASAASFSRSD